MLFCLALSFVESIIFVNIISSIFVNIICSCIAYRYFLFIVYYDMDSCYS
jgi:hypothetical protein